MARPVVAIVGRPNVGKSTLFNRIAKQRLAIVDDAPGVTRDRLYADVKWLDREFIVIDTGGITDEHDTIQTQIRKQVEIAVEEADVLIMLIDGRESLTSSDFQVANLLRKTSKSVIIAVNKIEDFNIQIDPEIYSLGFGEPMRISAEHAKNIGDLLDMVLSNFKGEETREDQEQIRVTVAGRPNVGKSSLINALLGQERVIVSEQPGTTRDAIDIPITVNDTKYLLVDTAGMRRKSKVEESIEYYSVVRALSAIERSDVVLLVLDATTELAEQDLKIAGIIQNAGKACIILVNKWDLADKKENNTETFTAKIRESLDFIDYAPVAFVSAKTGQHLLKILPLVNRVMESFTFRVTTNRLNQIIGDAIAVHHPPSNKGRLFKIYFSKQIKVKPPTFLFTVNDIDGFHFSYQRYLENKLREYFDFTGTPIKFQIKLGSRKD